MGTQWRNIKNINTARNKKEYPYIYSAIQLKKMNPERKETQNGKKVRTYAFWQK